eukprot:Stramenopile-MAST_4_protein_2019
MSTWRKQKGKKYFRRVGTSGTKKSSGKKSTLASCRSVPPNWFPTRPDTASFSAAADIVAQMRYEQLCEARAKMIARNHWANVFTQKQAEVGNVSHARLRGKNVHPIRESIRTPEEWKAGGFLEPMPNVQLPSEGDLIEAAQAKALQVEEDVFETTKDAIGVENRFDRQIRLEKMTHPFFESHMLRKKLTEIQIQWDEKMKAERLHKEGKREVRRKLGNFVSGHPMSKTAELKHVNKFLERHNEFELKDRVARERMAAIKEREAKNRKGAVEMEKRIIQKNHKKRNKIPDGCYTSPPADGGLLFPGIDETRHRPRLASTVAVKRSTKDFQIILPPVPDRGNAWKALDPGPGGTIISGGIRIKRSFKWK